METFFRLANNCPFPCGGGYKVYKYYKKPSKRDEEQPLEDDETDQPLFIENWPLLDFARQYGKMRVVQFVNSTTGEPFKICIFTKNGCETKVYFFSRLGVLSPAEISQRQRELLVGKTAKNKLYLHNGNVRKWQDVDLELDEN